MSGAIERGHARLLDNYYRGGGSLLGSPGVPDDHRNRLHYIPIELVNDETGAAGDKRIAAAARSGHLMASERVLPVHVPDDKLGPEEYLG